MHEKLMHLKENLMEQLSEFGESSKIPVGSVDLMYKTAETLKDVCKILKMDEEEGEYSRAYGRDAMGPQGSYRGGSYADDGASYRRDRMGRYSREDGYSRTEDKSEELHEVVNKLRRMAKDLPQPTQRAIQDFTEMVG